MLLTRKTTSPKTLISRQKALKPNISERKVPFGCGWECFCCQEDSSPASSSIRAGPMRTSTGTRRRPHLCTRTRTTPQTPKTTWYSVLPNTTTGGMPASLKDRTFFLYNKLLHHPRRQKDLFQARRSQPTSLNPITRVIFISLLKILVNF
jgi:hypothetical protein